MYIQIRSDVFSASKRKIHSSILGRTGLPWWWRLFKSIIMKRALIMRYMNSWMLIWKSESSGDAAHHSVRHLKNKLGSLHCRIRGE